MQRVKLLVLTLQILLGPSESISCCHEVNLLLRLDFLDYHGKLVSLQGGRTIIHQAKLSITLAASSTLIVYYFQKCRNFHPQKKQKNSKKINWKENVDASRILYFVKILNFKLINYLTEMCRSCQGTTMVFKLVERKLVWWIGTQYNKNVGAFHGGISLNCHSDQNNRMTFQMITTTHVYCPITCNGHPNYICCTSHYIWCKVVTCNWWK
jgi:hypothetical protein